MFGDAAVRVDRSEGRGRGVFAAQPFIPGDEVCSAPYTRYSGQQAAAIRDTELYWHTFVDPSQAATYPSDVLVVWGAISMLNHSREPNVVVDWQDDIAILKATKPIAENQELFMTYVNAHEYSDIGEARPETKPAAKRPYFSAGMDCYGLHSAIDCRDCNENILSIDVVSEFLESFAKSLGMVVAAAPIVERIDGERPDQVGLSGVQFLTTSSITIHTNDQYRDAYIDVFSCREYDTDAARAFVRKWFAPMQIIGGSTRRGAWQ